MCPISFLLFCAFVAARQRGHFLNVLQWERRPAQRLHGNAHELHWIIVRRHAIGAECVVALASVDD